MVPRGYEAMVKPLKRTIRETMLAGNLGSCFLLLVMISFSLFPIFKHHLGSSPRLQQKVIRALLIPLAVADIVHIALTLYPLPLDLVLNPVKWTTLIWGNVGITFGLFIVRMLWIAGAGRDVLDDTDDSRKTPSASELSSVKYRRKSKRT